MKKEHLFVFCCYFIKRRKEGKLNPFVKWTLHRKQSWEKKIKMFFNLKARVTTRVVEASFNVSGR